MGRVEDAFVPLNSFAKAIAEKFKRRITESLSARLLEVRVFGSMARGDADEDSDFDILVMVDERDSDLDRRIYDAAYDVAYEERIDCRISPLIMTRAHFEELIRRERMLARDILNEGVAV